MWRVFLLSLRAAVGVAILWCSILSHANGPAPGTELSSSATTFLFFDFSKGVSDNFWQVIHGTLVQNDLQSLLGQPVVVLQQKPATNVIESFGTIQVALTGECTTGRDAGSIVRKGPLAWVYLVDGRIRPLVFVDCDQIGKALYRELRGRTISERQQFMATAISHVIVHELTHIATNSPRHQKTGLQKARLTPADLIANANARCERPRFSYEQPLVLPHSMQR